MVILGAKEARVLIVTLFATVPVNSLKGSYNFKQKCILYIDKSVIKKKKKIHSTTIVEIFEGSFSLVKSFKKEGRKEELSI